MAQNIPIVAIINGIEEIDACLEKFVPQTSIKGKKVFLKPNVREAATPGYLRSSVTSISVINAVVQWFTRHGAAKITIGECTSSRLITRRALENSCMGRFSSEKVTVVNLNEDEFVTVPLYGKGALKKIEVARSAVESDFRVSLPVLKTHVVTDVTISMKNLMGCVSPRTMNRLHMTGLEAGIAILEKKMNFDLAVVDAMYCMEGQGPTDGKERYIGKIAVSNCLCSVDSILAHAIGLTQNAQGHISLALNSKNINSDTIKVEGIINATPFIRADKDVFNLYGNYFFNFLMQFKIVRYLCYEIMYSAIKKMIRILIRKNRRNQTG